MGTPGPLRPFTTNEVEQNLQFLNIMIVQETFTSYAETVTRVLDALNAGQVLSEQPRILIKPNLVNTSPYPVTTPPACVEAIITYIRTCSDAGIVIAEGCGAAECETEDVFEELGYTELASRHGVGLVDLNTAETVLLKEPSCRIFPEFHMPALAMDHYIISVPVLKAHSLAEITGTMKNMMGFAPPRYYQRGGYWKKSAFHARMHQSIIELNRYRAPDLTVLDATTGLAEYHLGGSACSPPVNRIVGGYTPREIDRCAAELLGMDWKMIPHLAD
jgi:uncharacterized protein (DUF362 family)